MNGAYLRRLARKYRAMRNAGPRFTDSRRGHSNILDDYVTSAPSAQNSLDIFKGQWSSRFPQLSGHLVAGSVPLFEDPRMAWAGEQIGGFRDRSVLELGPLEAGHTYMLEEGGASSIIAVEANARAYLKCLIVKELLQLERAQFLLGDFLEYLRSTEESFDICVANGVLYHMREPAELIYLISRVSSRTIIWTQYYDEAAIEAKPEISRRFSEVKSHEFRGFGYETHKYAYLEALNGGGFCGGTAPFSRWMLKQDILSCLKHFGFTKIEIEFDSLETANGPSCCLACSR